MMFMGVEMDIQKEREAFEAWFLNKYQYSAEYFQITKFDADRGFYTAIDHYNPDSVNSAWVLRSSFDSWQAAKAQAVPEGFVLVPKLLSDELADELAIDAFNNIQSMFDYEHRGSTATHREEIRLRWCKNKARDFQENYKIVIEAQEQSHD